MHYDGHMENSDKNGHYVGGKVQYWDYVDPDCLSILELDGLLTDVGYLVQVKTKDIEEYRILNGYAYYYKVNGQNMREGLVELKSDQELLAMAQEVVEDKKVVEVYLIKRVELESGRKRDSDRVPIPQNEGGSESDGDSGFVDDENEASEDDFDINDFEGGGYNQNLIIDNVIGEDADTDCGDSDYLGSVHSSDDEGSTRRRFQEFNPARDMENPQFFLGQIFSDLKTFREAIRSYSIKNKFPLRFVHSDRGRVQVCCEKNCKWNIWVSPSPNRRSVEVKSYNGEHNGCVLVSRHKWFTYKYIAKKYLLRFEIDPKWGNDSIVQTCEEDFHYTTSRWTAR
ncbi:unnamed protein product [Linum trigynum]|uniref:Transposase MuDR plant domain-containing protein n=1 Tax=Linum trigynum TaxID=586398 RepID=A0AAV2EQN5_9ROSI